MTITGNDIPENSEEWRPGLCLVKDWKKRGIVNSGATIELMRGENVINVDELPDCGDGWITAQEIEKAEANVIVYQTSDKAIFISTPWDNYNVAIYDISGSLVYQITATENIQICHNLNLQPGAYAVRVGGANVSIGRLIVIK